MSSSRQSLQRFYDNMEIFSYTLFITFQIKKVLFYTLKHLANGPFIIIVLILIIYSISFQSLYSLFEAVRPASIIEY